MINSIIFINGIYDLICGFTILFFSSNTYLKPIANLHPMIFKEEFRNDLIKRLLAYWIITYGTIRTAVIFKNNCIFIMIIISYFIEILAYSNENYLYKTTDNNKVLWINGLSFLIIILFIYNNN
jgi:hypothetical protein